MIKWICKTILILILLTFVGGILYEMEVHGGGLIMLLPMVGIPVVGTAILMLLLNYAGYLNKEQ